MGAVLRFVNTGALVVGLARRGHWGLLAVCAGFLLAGALVVDDYGVSPDAWTQQASGRAALDYLAGDGERAFDQLPANIDRYYGPVFEASLVLVERALGLDGWRELFLSRHILTHLFFLVGGAFCYLLVLRMFGNRLLALAAMVLFLLHPRLYAHSFFNSKDVPFAAMFMVALYLTHRAFRRDTLAAFLLCGVGVGLLVNLRIMGLVLFAAVLVLRALDLLLAGSAGERRRVLLAGVAFALGAVLTYYATLPALWTDPGKFSVVIRQGTSHINAAENLFRGQWLHSPDGPPFEYLPVWIGITTPPAVFLLAAVSVVALFWRGARRPRDIWRKGELRYGLLLLVLFVAPPITIFVIGANIYNGWRQVYFLYAPLVPLMFIGFHWILVSRGRWMKTSLYALAVTGVAVTIVSTVRIHPFQSEYFNALADRNGQDHLVSRYHVDYWKVASVSLVKDAMDDHPDQIIGIMQEDLIVAGAVLVASDQERIVRPGNIFFNGFLLEYPDQSREYAVRVYNNAVSTARSVYLRADDPDSFIRLAMSGDPVFRSDFTVWLRDNAVVYFNEDCTIDSGEEFGLSVYPVDTDVLSGVNRLVGYEPIRVVPRWEDVMDEDGGCAWIVILPPYAVASVVAGHYRVEKGIDVETTVEERWRVRFGVTPPDVDPAVLAGAPAARSTFDVYRAGRELVYVKEPCTDEDIEVRFGIDTYPHDPGELEAGRWGDGFNHRLFDFWDHGVRVGERCVAVVPLPDYRVAGVRTGQIDYGGWHWEASFAVEPVAVDEGVLAGEPVARGDFAIYRDGDALVYVREGCTEEDAGGLFFLNVAPVDAGDLPTGRVGHGFDNLNFHLWRRDGAAGERCVAVAPLPEYPVASVYTGQYERWAVGFGIAPVAVAEEVLAGEPVARGDFAVYRDGDMLVYVRDGCTEEEAGAWFLLHVAPVDVGDLPADRMRHGFDNLDFSLWQRGSRFDGRCVAAIPVPGYAIASIRTGQYDEGGERWSVEFTLPDGE